MGQALFWSSLRKEANGRTVCTWLASTALSESDLWMQVVRTVTLLRETTNQIAGRITSDTRAMVRNVTFTQNVTLKETAKR